MGRQIVSKKEAVEQYIEQNVCRKDGHRFGVIYTTETSSWGGTIYAMCDRCGKVITVLQARSKTMESAPEIGDMQKYAER